MFNKMTGIIYKLKVGNYYYIGQTKQKFKTRINQHRRDCFNKKKKGYETKKYKKFRELGVNKDNWCDMVKGHIVYECEINEMMYYEYALININDPYCLNTCFKEVDAFFIHDYKERGSRTLEDIKKYKKLWNEKNEGYFKEYSKNRYEKNKECRKRQMRNYNMNTKNIICKYCKTNPMNKSNYSNHCKGKKHKLNVSLTIKIN